MNKLLIAALAGAAVVGAVVIKKTTGKRREAFKAATEATQHEFAEWLRTADDAKAQEILRGYDALSGFFSHAELQATVSSEDYAKLAGLFVEKNRNSMADRSLAMAHLVTGVVHHKQTTAV